MKDILKYINYLINLLKLKEKSIIDIIKDIVKKNNLKEICIIEVGVFKGDNALSLIEKFDRNSIGIHYFGFDLFEDIDYLKEKYPNDFSQYNQQQYPYWEFNSGQHTLEEVNKKLSKYKEKHNIQLIQGDTTQTLSEFINNNLKLKIDYIYIDGCHDYNVVKSDWEYCSYFFAFNPLLIIAFDDYFSDGVRKVYDEINNNSKFTTKKITKNQFIVTLSSIKP